MNGVKPIYQKPKLKPLNVISTVDIIFVFTALGGVCTLRKDRSGETLIRLNSLILVSSVIIISGLIHLVFIPIGVLQLQNYVSERVVLNLFIQNYKNIFNCKR